MNRAWFAFHKNKIFAVTFASLALLTFILAYVLYGVGFGFGYLASSPFTVINLLLNVVILTMLLVTNVQNDNRAFTAIMMLVFLVVWDAIVSWIPGASGLFAAFYGGTLSLVLGIFLALGMLATAFWGIFAYVFLIRYRLGRASWERQMLYSRVFVACLAAELILEVATVMSLIAFDGFAFSFYLLSNASTLFAGVACLFTLRRLRQ